MARRKSSKLQPVPLKLNFAITLNSADGTNYIDISQCVSAISRKFFRQGLNWAVAGGRFLLPAAANAARGTSVYLSTLPHSWSVSNSWHKGFSTWTKMLDEYGLDDAPSIKPKFLDFKIYSDPLHQSMGSANNLLPVNMGPGNTLGPYLSSVVTTGPVVPGEWIYSKYNAPTTGGLTTVDYHIHMVGADVPGTSVGLIQNYALSRAVPQSPDPSLPPGNPSIFNALFDEGTVQTDAVIADLEDENDELPYDQMNYPGGDTNFIEMENQHFHLNTNTVGITTSTFTGFTAPCGLLRLDFIGADVASEYPIILELELMPGRHRGYAALPMQDM